MQIRDQYTPELTGDGDTPDFTLTTTGAVLEQTLALPGGVVVSLQASNTVWSFGNLHGDTILTTDGAGARQGQVAWFDPFGNPVDPTTHRIDTTGAKDAVPADTTQAGASYGWEGTHQKLYEHEGSIATIEMGARRYVPTLGWFLSVDPVLGGNTTAYNYPNDPINMTDLDGNFAFLIPLIGVAIAEEVLVTVAIIAVGVLLIWGAYNAIQSASSNISFAKAKGNAAMMGLPR